jgi:hypothetical protein
MEQYVIKIQSNFKLLNLVQYDIQLLWSCWLAGNYLSIFSMLDSDICISNLHIWFSLNKYYAVLIGINIFKSCSSLNAVLQWDVLFIIEAYIEYYLIHHF